ncbi:hypothetical protein [Rothia sp. ZJ932]|uniref:hypothetical protein n=1 Tax=Rothia sp. ZJ932 TaxID=2810516 RepID=UPI001967D5C4|nr:hypothetical protein [Rothia sp. ZJ932]QRZ61720.1 hypothetical protein JR346_00810 [Rothia sp. ZJ932]
MAQHNVLAFPAPEEPVSNRSWGAAWEKVPADWQQPVYRLDQEPNNRVFVRNSNYLYSNKTYDYRTGYSLADRELAWYIYTIWVEGTLKVDPAMLRWYVSSTQSLIERQPAKERD